jgi:hypothetical protein
VNRTMKMKLLAMFLATDADLIESTAWLPIDVAARRMACTLNTQ